MPILLNGEKYGEIISKALDAQGFFQWQYDEQCEHMVLLAVTSLFTTQEHKLYRDNIQSYWADNGIILRYEK